MGLQSGDVVQYGTSDWCVHGIAVVHGEGDQLWAADTYWGDTAHTVPLSGLEGKPVIGNITTFSTSLPYPYAYDDFRDEDKFYIPIGGSSSKYWIRKDTPPDPAKVEERLRYTLQKAHDKVKSAAQDVEWNTKQLLKFQFKQEEYHPKARMMEVQLINEEDK